MEFGLGFGSNLGDRARHLRAAAARVLETADARLVAKSSIYETEPVDVRGEHSDKPFLNAVMIIESAVPAHDWLRHLNRIETELGRVRGEDKNAPRLIDIDILYAGGTCVDSGGLTVPHPRWARRRFVLAPLAEVRGDMRLPGQAASVREILDALDDEGGGAVAKLEAGW